MRKRTLLVGSLSLLLAACGGGGSETTAPPPAAGGGGAAPAANAPAATATVAGKISFDGTLPANTKIQMAADPYCMQNAKSPMTEEYVGENGGLGNVIVYVSSPVSATFPTPTDAVTIDQHDCHYVPHVFTIMVGQKLSIKNSDTTLHDHGWTEAVDQKQRHDTSQHPCLRPDQRGIQHRPAGPDDHRSRVRQG
jgi:hypothetical protein